MNYCPRKVTIKDKIVVGILIVIGTELVLYFAAWWLEPQHRRNFVLFAILTFIVFWELYWALVNWYYLLNVSEPEPAKPEAGLTVDIFTTAMPGEPYEMFDKTLRAIKAIRYPHNTYLLDGSGDPALEALCKEIGINRINCENVGGAKAGKVNYALNQTGGEYVLVLDPDHVPEPDFLDRVLGYFKDPGIGFVQVVQAYYNQGKSIIARAAAEQSYGFYGPILMGMYRCGMALVIGANCTFRRAALKSIGGHAVHLAEDIATAIRLHSKGWKGIYVPVVVSHGLVPEDLNAYFKQQLKWSRGMFKLFFKEYLKLFPGLTWRQRLSYFFSGTYYLTGLATFAACVMIILFLFFGWWAVDVTLRDFLLHITPYIIIAFIIDQFSQRWLREPSEKGIHWKGMLLKTGTWPIYVMSFIYLLAGVEVPYIPTPKTKGEVPIVLLIPHMAIIALSVLGIVYCVNSYQINFIGAGIMIFFAVCNIILMASTILMAYESLLKKIWRRSNG